MKYIELDDQKKVYNDYMIYLINNLKYIDNYIYNMEYGNIIIKPLDPNYRIIKSYKNRKTPTTIYGITLFEILEIFSEMKFKIEQLDENENNNFSDFFFEKIYIFLIFYKQYFFIKNIDLYHSILQIIKLKCKEDMNIALKELQEEKTGIVDKKEIILDDDEEKYRSRFDKLSKNGAKKYLSDDEATQKFIIYNKIKRMETKENKYSFLSRYNTVSIQKTNEEHVNEDINHIFQIKKYMDEIKYSKGESDFKRSEKQLIKLFPISNATEVIRDKDNDDEYGFDIE